MGKLKNTGLILLVLVLVLTVFILVRSTESGPNFLDEEFSEIVNYIPQRDRRNAKVSEVDVAWHLDHSLKTINRICEWLEQSNPEKYRPSFSLSRVVVLSSGIIPRGVAQSPKSVRPPKEILTDSLYLQIEEAKINLQNIENLDANAHFRHPYFDVINKRQTKRFLKVHTVHHLKIIRDILKK